MLLDHIDVLLCGFVDAVSVLVFQYIENFYGSAIAYVTDKNRHYVLTSTINCYFPDAVLHCWVITVKAMIYISKVHAMSLT